MGQTAGAVAVRFDQLLIEVLLVFVDAAREKDELAVLEVFAGGL